MALVDDARSILQATVDRKVAALDAFATVRAQREDAAERLRQIETAEADAWAELKRLDWSDTELKSLGVAAPAGAGGKRPTARAKSRRGTNNGEPERS